MKITHCIGVLSCALFLFSAVIFQANYRRSALPVSKQNNAPFQTKIPIFYINLDRSLDRNDYMNKAFNKTGNLVRVPAVDGNSEWLNDVIGGNLEMALIAGKCSKNELALAASHMRAIRQAYDSGASAAIIMEDDVSPIAAPFWTTSLDDLVRVADVEEAGWQMIRLQHSIVTRSRRRDAMNGWRENPNNNFTKKNYIAYGMAAYLVSRNGMRFFVERFLDQNGKFDILRRKKSTSGSCVADFLFPKEADKVLLKAPPMFVTRIFEDSTGVRKAGKLRTVNDQWLIHYQDMLDSFSWIVEAYETLTFWPKTDDFPQFPHIWWNVAIDDEEETIATK